MNQMKLGAELSYERQGKLDRLMRRWREIDWNKDLLNLQSVEGCNRAQWADTRSN